MNNGCEYSYWRIMERRILIFQQLKGLQFDPIGGSESSHRGGWRVIQNPNYCLGNYVNSMFVSVPPLVEGLRRRAEPSTPNVELQRARPSHSHSLCRDPHFPILAPTVVGTNNFFKSEGLNL